MSRPFLTGKSIVWYCWGWSKWQSKPVKNAPVCTVGSTVNNSQSTTVSWLILTTIATCHKRSAVAGGLMTKLNVYPPKTSSCNLQFFSELITTQLRMSHGVTANTLYLSSSPCKATSSRSIRHCGPTYLDYKQTRGWCGMSVRIHSPHKETTNEHSNENDTDHCSYRQALTRGLGTHCNIWLRKRLKGFQLHRDQWVRRRRRGGGRGWQW